MSNPIPRGLRPAFIAHMAAHDNNDLPDGAWFAVLEDAAESFMKSHKLTQPWRCPNDAVHAYLAAEKGDA